MNYFNDNDGNNLRKWSIIDTEFNIVMTLEDDLYIDATDEHSTDFSNGYIRTVDRATNLMGFIRLEDEEPINAVTVSGTVTSSDSDTTDTGNDLINITLANEENSYSKTLISSGVNNTVAYSIEGVSTGIYTMTVQKDDHIDREYTVVVGSDDVTQDVEICLLGDVNGDGRVNVGDANLVYKHALQTKLITDEYTLLCSNVNGDARVNVGDANLIYKHALQTKKLW